MSDKKTYHSPPKPSEPLPKGWDWVYSYGEWLPTHTWSDMNTQNAGEAWLLEATGRMGPHEDSSKVNLAPKDDVETLKAKLSKRLGDIAFTLGGAYERRVWKSVDSVGLALDKLLKELREKEPSGV